MVRFICSSENQKDDLRKDARLMDFNSMINKLSARTRNREEDVCVCLQKDKQFNEAESYSYRHSNLQAW